MIKLWDTVESEDTIYPAYIECIHYLIREAPDLLHDHAGLILQKNINSIRNQTNFLLK